MTGAELAARITAARAALGDFHREVWEHPRGGAVPDYPSWALRLAESLGLLLAELSAQPPALTQHQRAVLGQALADAQTYRDPSPCADCDVHPAGLCDSHAAGLDKADSYLTLARALGIEVQR